MPVRCQIRVSRITILFVVAIWAVGEPWVSGNIAVAARARIPLYESKRCLLALDLPGAFPAIESTTAVEHLQMYVLMDVFVIIQCKMYSCLPTDSSYFG